jgi:hypothetical protein
MKGAQGDVDGNGANDSDRIEGGQAFEIVAHHQHQRGDERRNQRRQPGDAEAIQALQDRRQFLVAGHQVLHRDHVRDRGIRG